ncbi:hypothetical protein EKH77_25330 [Streptomyces luteoverticillatus]|uniref:Uncharacterized protein n=1 Tax=Streptomyces luteoverticillatus TaxID=66425 RepID=A0A3S9PP68_STRLT|nr:hypothetical protein [Streptomyces luteoverticillatus]AZQ74104.1 hypothetical protein EKH77_25330 [Streptomyces luteoverticillatus]
MMHPTAAQWLVSRETHPREAREAWARGEPAIIRMGVHVEAVRLPARFVHARAGGEGRAVVEGVFRQVGVLRAVIADAHRRWYYALVPPGTSAAGDEPRLVCCGTGGYLGVPPTHRVEPPGTYWLLAPPAGEADLCDLDALRELAAAPVRG